jgi:hypothetical protein
MAQLPTLKDWKSLLEQEVRNKSFDEVDILNLINACHDYTEEMQPVSQWIGAQQSYVSQMQRTFMQVYTNMFGKEPPPRTPAAPVIEVLGTTERRKQIVREVALAVTKAGDEVTDEALLEQLSRRGMRIETPNPTATISTILNGFKSEFKKVEGKRGVFKRQTPTS